MNTVPLRILKEHLGEYVARARDGETLVITDRGREVAELVPLSAERRAVRALQSEGKLDWSGGKPQGADGVRAKGAPVSETVLEGRG